jgi:hypothetical protein
LPTSTWNYLEYSYMNIYVPIYYICIHMHIYVHTHIYIHMCIHTHLYM